MFFITTYVPTMCRYSSVNQKYENNTADRIVRPNRNEDFTGNMQVITKHIYSFFYWNYMVYSIVYASANSYCFHSTISGHSLFDHMICNSNHPVRVSRLGPFGDFS